MDYPTYVMINGERYDINVDFRVAIECNKIAEDKSINDFERALAIIYKLYGEKGLNDFENHEELLKKGVKFLSFGKTYDDIDVEERDMDYVEDMDYIEASFMSDYHIDLSNTKMHWWKFYKLISGLSNSEFGDCCVLNRVRNLRNYDTKDIKDRKEREKIEKAKKAVALKSAKKEIVLTDEQERSMNNLNKLLGI